MKYAIWCRVSGGMTGTRTAWMKCGGKIALFDTLEEAEETAAINNKAMNGNPHRTADFSYTAMEYEDGFERRSRMIAEGMDIMERRHGRVR